jgi:hypothetical protein
LYIFRSVLQPKPSPINYLQLGVRLIIASCSKLFKFTQCPQWSCNFQAFFNCKCQ